MSETKPKSSAATLRTPKPKKPLGLVVPPALRLPHEDLIRSEIAAQKQIETPATHPGMTSQSNQTSLPSMTTQPGQTDHTFEIRQTEQYKASNEWSTPIEPSQTANTSQTSIPGQTSPSSTIEVAGQTSPHLPGSRVMAPVAPTRDFTRVANSITREAVPAGLFAGKGKQLYDYLYILTRGAIVPSRTIRISRTKLMAGAGIGSRVTFDANISRLSSVGLIEVRSIAGEHVGNEYTVYLPEERGLTSQTSSTSLTAGPVRHSHAHNPDRLVSPQTSQSMHTVNPVSTMVYEEPNTLFKTKYDDDKSYLFQELIIELLKACREITGVEPANNDAERQRWGMIGRTLVDELRDAARNTNNVTSIPAFLAAHLKRRFAKSSAEPARSGQREGRLQRPGSTPVSESAIADGASTVESRRLTESEIKNQAESLAELMKLGYSDEEASVQLAPQYSPEDWKSIMEEVHARLGGDKLEATEGN